MLLMQTIRPVVALMVLWLAFLGADCSQAHPHAPDVEESLLRGTFEEQISKIAEHLLTERSVEAQCHLGSTLYLLASQHRRDLPSLKDDTIEKIMALVNDPVVEGDARCVKTRAADVIALIGPRAKAAIPGLERALAVADAAEASRIKSDWDRINPHPPDSARFRAALKAVGGR